MIPRYKIRKPRPHKVEPLPSTKPSFAKEEPEVLFGSVQGKPASAGEEYFANSLTRNKNVAGFEFRMAVAAPRYMPGWKELDFAVSTLIGILYAIEIDTEFTHRDKGASDVLHDAIVLKSLARKGMVYPQVFHVIADSPAMTDQFVKRVFG